MILNKSNSYFVAHIDSAYSDGIGAYGIILQTMKVDECIDERRIKYAKKISRKGLEIPLLACIRAYEEKDRNCRIILNVNHLRIIDNINKSINKWKENDFKRSDGKPIAHADLWKRLTSFIEKADIIIDNDSSKEIKDAHDLACEAIEDFKEGKPMDEKPQNEKGLKSSVMEFITCAKTVFCQMKKVVQEKPAKEWLYKHAPLFSGLSFLRLSGGGIHWYQWVYPGILFLLLQSIGYKAGLGMAITTAILACIHLFFLGIIQIAQGEYLDVPLKGENVTYRLAEFKDGQFSRRKFLSLLFSYGATIGLIAHILTLAGSAISNIPSILQWATLWSMGSLLIVTLFAIHYFVFRIHRE